jgi:hypothetical protein
LKNSVKVWPFLLFFLSFSCELLADPEALKNAERFVGDRDKSRVDFYLARCLSTMPENSTDQDRADLLALIKKRKLNPVAFIPFEYDEEFLEWFERSANARWNASPSHFDEALGTVEIQSAEFGGYALTLVAYPEIQSWYLTDESQAPAKPMVLALGHWKKKPFLILVKQDAAAPRTYRPVNLNTQGRALHAVWKPEFEDLDGDGKPEVWIRYNLAWGNGFSQVLDIFKLDPATGLKLYKHFLAENEGVARRLEGNRIELGSAFGSRADFSRREFDKYHFKVFEFKEGKFKKVDAYDLPHILKSKEWKKYYL